MAELTDAQKVLRNDTGKRIAAAIEALGGTPPISLGMTGATPGQVPVINTVDANGAPTSYRPGAGGGGGTADALPLAGGTMEGDIDMDGNAVTGLPTPNANSDAVPKSYADNIVAVSDTQPTATENKLWVDTDAGAGTSYQIPTVAEMETADAQVAALIDEKHVPVWPTPTIYNSVQNVVDAMSTLPTNSFLLNTFGSNLRTDLFNTASSYDGFIVCFKASGNNIYFLAFSRDVAGIGNINIPNISVTYKHDLL